MSAKEITIYRKLTLPSRDDLRFSGVGVAWSSTEEAAHPHWGYASGDTVLLTLTAVVFEDAVDFEETAVLERDNALKWGTVEDEVRLRPGVAVTVKQIKTEFLVSRSDLTARLFAKDEKPEPIIEYGAWHATA